MDSILRMPGGCFEQTSSSTYPNVLALDYMKRTKKLTPEVHAKAEGYIANGYQRLLTFEVPGGGFSWFGQAPANKILTAYGLMEFCDMSKVHDVDPKADRSGRSSGSRRSSRRMEAGSRTRSSSTKARPTGTTPTCCASPRTLRGRSRIPGYQGPAVEKARQYIEQHMGAGRRTRIRWRCWPTSRRTTGRTASSRGRRCSCCSTRAPRRTIRSGGPRKRPASMRPERARRVETTGLAAQALLKWGAGIGHGARKR